MQNTYFPIDYNKTNHVTEAFVYKYTKKKLNEDARRDGGEHNLMNSDSFFFCLLTSSRRHRSRVPFLEESFTFLEWLVGWVGLCMKE